MIAVPGEAPYDRAALRVFYPAKETEAAKETGVFPVELDDAAYPVIIFLPGVNCPPYSYYWLMETLAKRHFVVVILEWIAENLPGRVSYTPGIDLTALSPEMYGTKPTSSALSSILTDIHSLNEIGTLAGHIDMKRVVLGGHSAGGILALQNADRRWIPGIKAAFAICANPMPMMALGGWQDGKLPKLPATSGLVIGGTDDAIGDLHNQQFGRPHERGWETIQTMFETCYGNPPHGGDQFLVIFKNANHHTICNPLDETIGRTYLETKTSVDDDDLRGRMAWWIIAFLNVVLFHSDTWGEALYTWRVEPEDYELIVDNH
jgi:pimeloyl-ACP methyl ester carboxylesterase